LQSVKKSPPQRTIASFRQPRQDGHFAPASVRLIEPFFPPADSLPKGFKLPVYSRAGLWRIAPIVVALFWTAASTSASACGFHPVDAGIAPDRIQTELIGQSSAMLPFSLSSTHSRGVR
jgi:hypothetical protein